jgi:hypothetical protein
MDDFVDVDGLVEAEAAALMRDLGPCRRCLHVAAEALFARCGRGPRHASASAAASRLDQPAGALM